MPRLPWSGVGITERISIFSYQLWLAVLATGLLRRGRGHRLAR